MKLLNNINCPAAFSYLLAGSVTCVTTSSTTVMISCHVILTAGDTVPLRPRQSRIRGLTSDLRGWLSVTLRRLETVRQDRRSDEREVRREGVQEEREILISSPSGTSALLQTSSKCFLLAISFMTHQQDIKTVSVNIDSSLLTSKCEVQPLRGDLKESCP